jgi:hypothetical protein
MNSDINAVKRTVTRRKWRLFLAALAIAGLVARPAALLACAACYGQSDSALARGMNWGIFSLLGVVVFVLSGVTSFFVFLGKRAGTTPAEAPPAPGDEPGGKV